ncbi:MAG TPA: Gfo/Idh/MocA family oxidoreductase [Marmoricola sp.]|nr:Gfo/Idh/MocA family oxidoreductase [Marmoricola sp.]
MSELRVGLVGAGLIAGVHAHAYRASPGVRVVAVADPVRAKAERLAERYGAVAVGTVEELLDLPVDVVDVCTPPLSHADVAVTALDAGRHVLCEKPLARTLGDARRIVDAAGRAAGLFMVGHVSRFEPDHSGAKALVDAGRIGEVRMVTHTTTCAMPTWSEDGWVADPVRSGGPLVDQAVHSFDFARWVIGSPAVRVHCLAADTPAGPATYTLSTVRYANGAIAHVEAGWGHPASRGFKLAAEVVGTDGRITWSYDRMMGGVLHPSSGPVEWFDVLGDRGFTAELRAFTDAVGRGGPSPVPARDGMESLRTASAALESARTGRTVDLTTWEGS